jgi:hypothetical protein
LRQVDPLIRQLTLYRDLIQETESRETVAQGGLTHPASRHQKPQSTAARFLGALLADIVQAFEGGRMRTIHAALPAAVAFLLGAALTVRAQGQQPAIVGMPEYGVTLSGSPEDPVIENHSGKVIIGYNIETADANGRLVGGIGQIIAPSVLPAGLPDGKSLYAVGNFPVDPNLQRGYPVQTHFVSGRGPAVRATLTSVIFADGHFVGADERGIFERLGKELKAVKGAGILAKTGALDQLDAVTQAFRQMPPQAPPPGEDRNVYTFRGLAASRLVETWRRKGDAAAQQLAEIYSSLPTLWK